MPRRERAPAAPTMWIPYPQHYEARKAATRLLLKMDEETVRREGLLVRKLRVPEWPCNTCGHLNFPWAQSCRTCATSRPPMSQLHLITGRGRCMEEDELRKVISVLLDLEQEAVAPLAAEQLPLAEAPRAGESRCQELPYPRPQLSSEVFF